MCLVSKVAKSDISLHPIVKALARFPLISLRTLKIRAVEPDSPGAYSFFWQIRSRTFELKTVVC